MMQLVTPHTAQQSLISLINKEAVLRTQPAFYMG